MSAGSLGEARVAGERPDYRVTFRWLALAAMSYTVLMSIVAPALPYIQRELDVGPNDVTWILTAYLLSATVATPILGRLGDVFGKDRMLLVTLVVLCVGTVVCGAARALPLLVVGRALQGVGGAMFPLAFSIVRDEFPPAKLAFGLGFMSAIAGIGGGVGTLIAGPIISNLNYHWIFWLPLIPLAFTTFMLPRVVPSSPVRAGGGVNWVGAVLLATWLVLVLMAITSGNTHGWLSTRVVGLFLAGLAVAAVWIWQESGARYPVVDMRMMRRRAVWTTNLASLLIGYAMFSSFVLTPQFVQTPESAGYGFGATVTQASFFMLPSTIFMLTASLLMGRISSKHGPRRTLLMGAAISALAFFLLAVAHQHPWNIIVAQSLSGLGTGLSFASMPALIVSAVSASETGVATGVNTNIRNIGGSLGSQVSASLLAASAVAGVPRESGFTAAFLVVSAMLVLAVVAGSAIPARGRPAAPRETPVPLEPERSPA